MAADACEKLLVDSNAVVKLAKLREIDLGLFEKIKAHILMFLGKIRSVYKKYEGDLSDEAKALQSMTDALEKIYSLFEDAAVAATENYQAATIDSRDLADISEAKTLNGDMLFQHKAIEGSAADGTEDAFGDYVVDNSTKKWYTYTEEQYESFGWARANDLLSAAENECLRSLFADADKRGHKFRMTKQGEYMIPIGDVIEDKIVFMSGEIDSPVLTRLVVFSTEDTKLIDDKRREIYAFERRGIRTKTNGFQNVYTRFDVADYQSFCRSINKNVGHNDQLRANRGRGGGETQSAIGGTQNSFLPIVHTFKDISGKTRNVKRISSFQFMIDGNTHAPYSASIEDAVNAENNRVIHRYARKRNKTVGWVKSQLKKNRFPQKAERERQERY